MRKHSPGSNVDLPQSAPVRLRLSSCRRNASRDKGLSDTFTKAIQSFDPLKARDFKEGVITIAGIGDGAAPLEIDVEESTTGVGVGRSVGASVEVAPGGGVFELTSATNVADGAGADGVTAG